MFHIDKSLNNILKNNRYQASLFMDDLQISYRHPDMQEIEVNFQQCINKFVKISNENGFTALFIKWWSNSRLYWSSGELTHGFIDQVVKWLTALFPHTPAARLA